MNIKNKQIAMVIIALVAILSFTSCENSIKGEGESLVFTPIVSDFESIDLSLAADVTISYSDEASLTVEAQSNIYDNLKISVSKGILSIEEDKNVGNHNTVKLTIKMPSIKGVGVSGACYIDVLSPFSSTKDMSVSVSGDNKINFLDTITCNSFYYNVSGSSELNVTKSLVIAEYFESNISGDDRITISNMECSTLKHKASGSSYTNIAGKTTTQSINASGSLSYNALELLSTDIYIDISGAANIKVYASDNLDIKNSGATIVGYKGNPHITQRNSGDLSISNMN